MARLVVLHFSDPLFSPKIGDIYRDDVLYYVSTFRAGLVVLHFRDPLLRVLHFRDPVLSPKTGDIQGVPQKIIPCFGEP